jgi:hypothetical protein
MARGCACPPPRGGGRTCASVRPTRPRCTRARACEAATAHAVVFPRVRAPPLFPGVQHTGTSQGLQGYKCSEKDAKLPQKLGQLSVFSSCIPTGTHAPTCIFWATQHLFRSCVNEGRRRRGGLCGARRAERRRGPLPEPLAHAGGRRGQHELRLGVGVAVIRTPPCMLCMENH